MPRAKKLEVVVTDGTRVVRLIWLHIGSGRIICGSFFHPRIAMHDPTMLMGPSPGKLTGE